LNISVKPCPELQRAWLVLLLKHLLKTLKKQKSSKKKWKGRI